MSHHGSKLFRNDQTRFPPKDLKIITRVWDEAGKGKFRLDPSADLVEMVRRETGKHQYAQANDEVCRSFQGHEVYLVTQSGHEIQIPRNLRPLMVLCLHQGRGSYRRDLNADKIYLGPYN